MVVATDKKSLNCVIKRFWVNMSSSQLQVREVFSESLFLYSPDSVSIMDGTDEGTVSVLFLPYIFVDTFK